MTTGSRSAAAGRRSALTTGGPREGRILALFTTLALLAIGGVVALEESAALRDPSQMALRGEIAGLGEHSLLRRENLARALRVVAKSGRPLVIGLRVDPVSVHARVRDREGIRRLVAIDPGFRREHAELGEGLDRALRPEQIDAGAPERIVAAVTERVRGSADDVDYLVLSVGSIDGEVEWNLFLKRGRVDRRQFVAAVDGSEVRRAGEAAREEHRR
jgi:hypothetical protein